MSYRRSSIFAPAIAFLAVPICVADITPTFISGSVNASGNAVACVGFCDFNPVSDSFSFSATNSQPVYGYSQSRQAVATFQPLGIDTTSEADLNVQQTLNVNPLQLNVSMEIDDRGFAGPEGFESSASISASNDNELVFTVNSPAMVHLTGGSSFDEATFGFNIPNSNLENDFDFGLFGPGINIRGVECGNCSQPFDETLLFVPGIYELDVNEDLGAAVGASGFFSASESMTLNADFTPIPEPRWPVSTILAIMSLYRKRLHRPWPRRRRTD
jgi:hypothetical protein